MSPLCGACRSCGHARTSVKAYASHRRAGSSDEYSPEFPGQFPANVRKLSESSVKFRTCRAPGLVSHRRAFHAPIDVRVQLEEGVVGGRPLPVAGGLHPQDTEVDVPVVEQVLHAWVRLAVHLSRYAPKGRSSCVCTLGDPGKLPGVLNVQYPVTESTQKNVSCHVGVSRGHFLGMLFSIRKAYNESERNHIR